MWRIIGEILNKNRREGYAMDRMKWTLYALYLEEFIQPHHWCGPPSDGCKNVVCWWCVDPRTGKRPLEEFLAYLAEEYGFTEEELEIVRSALDEIDGADLLVKIGKNYRKAVRREIRRFLAN